MTIKELEKDYKAYQERREKAQKKVQELEAKLRESREEQRAAIEAEDPERYLNEKHRAEILEANLLVERRRASNPYEASPGEILNAWTGYLAGYTTEAEKLSAAVDKKLRELGALLREISALQRDARAKRAFLAMLAGIKEEDLYEQKQRFPMKTYKLPRIQLRNRSELLGIACDGLSTEEEAEFLSGFPANE